METEYLLPLMVGCLLLALSALGFRAERRRGFGPILLGLAASSLLLVGKFVLGSDGAVYGGIGGLVSASLWNAWPRPKNVSLAPTETLLQLGSIRRVEHGDETKD
jgi:hypothetical protein